MNPSGQSDLFLKPIHKDSSHRLANWTDLRGPISQNQNGLQTGSQLEERTTTQTEPGDLQSEVSTLIQQANPNTVHQKGGRSGSMWTIDGCISVNYIQTTLDRRLISICRGLLLVH